MGKNMYRAQILLEPGQHEALAEIARREERSISDVVREIVHEWLSDHENDVLWQQRRQTLDKLTQLRLKIQEEHGIYEGDFVEEMRAERDTDIDRIWRGET